MTRYGVSPWLARVSRARPAQLPRLREDLAADVAIVGGGLTGCLAAFEFARAGARTVLLEADRLGRGATAAGLGTILPTPGVPFVALRERHGLQAARLMWEASRRSALEFMALVRRLRIRCDLEVCDCVVLATDDAEADRLEREHAALHEAGLEAAWLGAARARDACGAEARAAIRLAGGGTIDPLGACLAFARRASAAGAVLHEQSPVKRIAFGRAGAEVTTTSAVVRAGTVVVATGLPGAVGLRALERHFRSEEQYAVALPPYTAAARRRFGVSRAIVTDVAEPPHAWCWTRQRVLVFAGAAQKPPPARQREKVLVQRTGQLMYELSLRYPHVSGTPATLGWAAPIVTGRDGAMVAGAHRAFPHHLFALGFGRSGANASWLASRILVRGWGGAVMRGDEAFGFPR